MTISVPEEIIEAQAKEAARKEAWFRLPGLEISKENNGDPADYLDFIKTSDSRVNLKVTSIMDFWGTSEFVIVSTNPLSPRQFFLAVSEDEFTKEFFR